MKTNLDLESCLAWHEAKSGRGRPKTFSIWLGETGASCTDIVATKGIVCITGNRRCKAIFTRSVLKLWVSRALHGT